MRERCEGRRIISLSYLSPHIGKLLTLYQTHFIPKPEGYQKLPKSLLCTGMRGREIYEGEI